MPTNEKPSALTKWLTWRCFASSILAMHFFNPLVYWLLYRMMLYQDLAADAVGQMLSGSAAICHHFRRWRFNGPTKSAGKDART
jgi:hypothetical protein